jgi:hypothetical protein
LFDVTAPNRECDGDVQAAARAGARGHRGAVSVGDGPDDRETEAVARGALGPFGAQPRLEQLGPMSAGLDNQATIGLHGLPLTPWQGLGVVTAWAAGALVLGGVALRLRDA